MWGPLRMGGPSAWRTPPHGAPLCMGARRADRPRGSGLSPTLRPRPNPRSCEPRSRRCFRGCSGRTRATHEGENADGVQVANLPTLQRAMTLDPPMGPAASQGTRKAREGGISAGVRETGRGTDSRGRCGLEGGGRGMGALLTPGRGEDRPSAEPRGAQVCGHLGFSLVSRFGLLIAGTGRECTCTVLSN